MPRTATERRLLEEHAAQSRGVLIPILEKILEKPLSVDDAKDRAFMLDLMEKRARKREKDVFSPSMLGSCVRQAYFAKTGQTKKPATSPRTNGYFLDGDFRHYKWQFALWKAHRAGLLKLIGCELRVFHPAGDFAGTIDAIVEINGVLYIVDFKGMHLRSYQDFERHGTPDNYRIQIVGYAEIVNQRSLAEDDVIEIKTVLLIGENKSGPSQNGSPLGLIEDAIIVSEARAIMKRRMHTLRRHVAEKTIPDPACTSIRTKGFQECPFAWYCRDEVREIQRNLESEKRGKLRVRLSTRSENKSRRKKSLPGKKSN